MLAVLSHAANSSRHLGQSQIVSQPSISPPKRPVLAFLVYIKIHSSLRFPNAQHMPLSIIIITTSRSLAPARLQKGEVEEGHLSSELWTAVPPPSHTRRRRLMRRMGVADPSWFPDVLLRPGPRYAARTADSDRLATKHVSKPSIPPCAFL